MLDSRVSVLDWRAAMLDLMALMLDQWPSSAGAWGRATRLHGRARAAADSSRWQRVRAGGGGSMRNNGGVPAKAKLRGRSPTALHTPRELQPTAADPKLGTTNLELEAAAASGSTR
ncbi:hypothetical protein C2845_PM11G19570 [Panicum miliaceum]|uniref:Uncharacterized protein n=1 Tax=Panicum miliaceum TaxID=4540 RepID=A0A3L6RPB9_PANMI|nr:hypothetical protein C2845_PM11G19570 [Panicum miliaceum]